MFHSYKTENTVPSLKTDTFQNKYQPNGERAFFFKKGWKRLKDQRKTENKVEPFRISHADMQARSKISLQLQSYLPEMNARPIIIICIGTDRSTGDSLGPFIGTMLQEKGHHPFHLYGTLESPVHALNLEETIIQIHKKYTNPFIISIDACLGRHKNIGTIQIGDGPLKPGAGVNKKLPPVGDVHITGTVNVGGFMEFFVLQNTRLHLIFRMAQKIAGGIHLTSLTYQRHELQQYLKTKLTFRKKVT